MPITMYTWYRGWVLPVLASCLLVTVGVTYVEALDCYTCKTSVRYSDCAENGTLVDNTTCASNQPYCIVVSNETMGMVKLYSVTRACSATCIHQGCGIFGDGVDYLLCRSCCTEDLCNVGSGALSNRISLTTIFLTCALPPILRKCVQILF